MAELHPRLGRASSSKSQTHTRRGEADQRQKGDDPEKCEARKGYYLPRSGGTYKRS